ncbi:MAG: type II secretion system protein [Phycisphaerales bacterium]|nr:type II secretion system protein [Phycisphaerales bacterium]
MRRRPGFTLVEILIVVVILGVLAAIVIPQMSSASTQAIRAHLGRNLQAIESQIEIYRANNAGLLPTNDIDDPMGEGEAKDGWGILVSSEYLQSEPMNFFADSTVLLGGDEATAIAAGPDVGNGWFYEAVGNTIRVYAAGYDRVNDTLSTDTP